MPKDLLFNLQKIYMVLAGKRWLQLPTAWYAVGVGGSHEIGAVEADFESENNITCETPYTVLFQNNSKGADDVIWYFGDGTTSNEQNPSHEYTSEGVYTVKLRIMSSCGEDSISKIDFVSLDKDNPCILTMQSNTTIMSNSCNGVLFDDGGSDGNYMNASDSYVLISPDNATSVGIKFTEFNVEQGITNCEFDYLSLYDGSDATAAVLGQFCDNKLPDYSETILSSGSSMFIHLHADGFENRKGFRLEWSCEKTISGIDESSIDEISLFPNPATNDLYYNFSDLASFQTGVIYNSKGVRMSNIAIFEKEGVIDVSNFPSGVLFFETDRR